MDEASPKGKILPGTEGLGTVTPEMIEVRAREIARGDGRAQPNDLDLTCARGELTGATSSAEKSTTREEPRNKAVGVQYINGNNRQRVCS